MATLKLLDVRVKEIIADEGNQFREKSTPEIIIKNMEDEAVGCGQWAGKPRVFRVLPFWPLRGD